MTNKMWNKIDIFFDIYKFYLILCSEPVVADSLISSFKKTQVQQMASTSRIKKII